VSVRSPQDAIKHGIGYVSEDRKGWGFVPGMSVRENLTLASLRTWTRGPFVRANDERAVATALMSELKVKATGPEQAVTYLSGGNQQKVVIGNRLLAKPAILILDEPTRGIDIGAKAEIYRLMKGWQAQGVAIIMISSELPEILGLSDRILVLANGKQTAILDRSEATQEVIMRYAMHKDKAPGTGRQ
jgi:inositol transport system ATP-binding protein